MAVGNALNAGSLARPMLPRVQPIAPIRRTEPFDDPEWVFDVKYDGFRGICYLDQGCCRMISRNGNLMTTASVSALWHLVQRNLRSFNGTSPRPLSIIACRLAGD